jgi:ribosomal protein S21
MKKDGNTVLVFNGDLETALRVLRWKMNNAKLLKTLKWCEYYPKKSDRKRLKRMFAERRRKKREHLKGCRNSL